jgi:hypothetical protein
MKWCGTTATCKSGWIAATSRRLTQKKAAPGSKWTGAWIGSRDGLDKATKNKIAECARNQIPVNSLQLTVMTIQQLFGHAQYLKLTCACHVTITHKWPPPRAAVSGMLRVASRPRNSSPFVEPKAHACWKQGASGPLSCSRWIQPRS